MSLEQIIGYVLISAMIGIVYLATRVVSTIEYRDNGIYHITVNAWFRGNKIYKDWLSDNTIYHWLIVLILCLIVIILCLIPPFSQGKMFNRPILSLIVSVPLWISIYHTYRWLFRKLDMI